MEEICDVCAEGYAECQCDPWPVDAVRSDLVQEERLGRERAGWSAERRDAYAEGIRYALGMVRLLVPKGKRKPSDVTSTGDRRP